MSNYPPSQDLSNQANESDGKTANTTAVLAPVVADPTQPDETTTKHPRSAQGLVLGHLNHAAAGWWFHRLAVIGRSKSSCCPSATPNCGQGRDN